MSIFPPASNLFEGTGGQCLAIGDPCEWTSCRHHIHNSAKDSQVSRGILTRTTCTLKLARQGGMTLEEVALMLGMTSERVRQIEFAALQKLKLALARKDITEGLAERR